MLGYWPCHTCSGIGGNYPWLTHKKPPITHICLLIFAAKPVSTIFNHRFCWMPSKNPSPDPAQQLAFFRVFFSRPKFHKKDTGGVWRIQPEIEVWGWCLEMVMNLRWKTHGNRTVWLQTGSDPSTVYKWLQIYYTYTHIYNIYTWFLACVGLLLLQFLIELKLGSAASDWEMYGILEVHPF